MIITQEFKIFILQGKRCYSRVIDLKLSKGIERCFGRVTGNDDDDVLGLSVG
jgi:hypothetical protein